MKGKNSPLQKFAAFKSNDQQPLFPPQKTTTLQQNFSLSPTRTRPFDLDCAVCSS